MTILGQSNAALEPVHHLKFYSIFLLRPKSRRSAPVGLCTPLRRQSKNCGVEGQRGNGSLGSRPNFRGASALLRGTSRAFSPKRASRDAPSVCLTGEGSAPPPRRPLPSGPGAAFLKIKVLFNSFALDRARPKLKFYSIFFKKLRGRGAEPLTRSALRAAAKRFERNPPKAGS